VTIVAQMKRSDSYNDMNNGLSVRRSSAREGRTGKLVDIAPWRDGFFRDSWFHLVFIEVFLVRSNLPCEQDD